MGKQRLIFRWAPLGLGLMLAGQVSVHATQPVEFGPEERPPVPMQAIPAIPAVTEPDWRAPVETAMMDRGRLLVTVKRGAHLEIKSPFVLDHPGRLVIDVPGIKLGNVGLPFSPDAIGNVPIKAIRFGQVDMNTVRIVVETDQPNHLQISVEDNRLMVSELRYKGFLGNVAHYIFGDRQLSQQGPANSPRPPQVASGVGPISTPRPAAPLPPAIYPELANLRKLEAESGFVPNGMPVERGRVLELARSQLGLSKDVNPTYVNQTFSLGKDNDWCADFVSTILEWSGGSPWGHLSRVQDIYTWALSNHRLTREPEPADVVVFSYGGNSFDHVALVESVSPDGTLTTIGGNEGHAAAAYKTSGSVLRSVYHLDDRRILGFVDPVAGSMTSGRILGNTPLPPLPSPPF